MILAPRMTRTATSKPANTKFRGKYNMPGYSYMKMKAANAIIPRPTRLGETFMVK
jgi:hypothetical protein